ncbi:threonine ammonia-lyase [Dongia deserti]|uniref:threonine ammonia-lyase n=1 Tax=Dongia deserti TaxID=2268030 RepID=UPI000E65E565|nr:pyridoxal-phosphate dependent enzyme [Dongia deserti]
MNKNWPTLSDIRATQALLAPHVVRTPTVPWVSPTLERLLGNDAKLFLKLELFQVTGTFKARGALTWALSLTPEQKGRGITAVSAGNHAIAAAFAAKAVGAPAKIIVLKSANPLRLAMARDLGADIVIAENGPEGFAIADRLVKEEGLTFIHPFDGPNVARGTGTLGAEIADDVPDLDAVVVAVGGGGLASGMARAIKLLQPTCKVYGVEPVGAPKMRRSFDEGAPVKLDRIDTIADSLAPPMSLPYGFELARAHMDDIVLVDDDAMCAALALLQTEAKLAVEPAAAAATAAAMGPLRERLAGKRVCLVICGANIDAETYGALLARGRRNLA